jgi:hypothetical protein
VIRELAENANTYQALGEGEARIVDPRYVIWIGPGQDPHWTVVQRLRLEEAGLEEAVAEIRDIVSAHGKRGCTWEVAGSATPTGLAARLVELGCVPDREPVAIGMVLRREPTWQATPGVVARGVESLLEHLDACHIAHTAFGMPEEMRAEMLANAGREWARRDTATGRSYLAFVEGRPVARATAAFTPHGVLLFGGATLEEARGRGAYRALIRARWEDAVARGTPVLVTHAGAMSRPILERLGFEASSRIEILLDETLGAVTGGQ